MKKSPYCAEEIQEEAIKCRYCNEFLNGNPPPRQTDAKRPWYFKTSILVFGLFCVSPFALPLLWFRPNTHWGWKVGLSVLTLMLTWFLTVMTKKSLHNQLKYYQMILEM